MNVDNLGDRLKMWERRVIGERTMSQLPVIARLDGRSFSQFTKDLNRPFDKNFVNYPVLKDEACKSPRCLRLGD